MTCRNTTGVADPDVMIEYEASGAERGEVQRMRVAKDEAVAAGDRIRASGGKVLEWWLVADVRGLGEKPSGNPVRRRIENARLASVRPADEVCVCGVPGCPEGPDYAPPDDAQSQTAKDNAQAAKDLAHLLRLLGVDSYEEATVVIAMSSALLRKVAECDDTIPGNEVVTGVRAFLAAGAASVSAPRAGT